MRFALKYLVMLSGVLLVMGAFSGQLAAQVVFEDDFEDRVQDQPLIGKNWTWYDQWFAEEGCTGEATDGFGPFDDGNGSDYEQENRNFWTAGGDDSYFRAGLEVPAWDGALTNMLRVYGNQYNNNEVCQRTLIFQEINSAPAAGAYTFSFDVAQDRDGAPANGEATAAFVKILDPADGYATVLFETVMTTPPAATSPEDVTTLAQVIEFTIEEEMVGKILQFGFYNDVTPSLGQSWGTSAALYDNIMVTPLEIGPAHSGSWYNDSQSGHGFSIEFGVTPSGAPLAIVYWYVYDSLGNPIFMTGTGTPDGNTVAITFKSPYGMQYGVFDPTSVERPDGGTAVFEFIDRDNAVFSYTPSDFSNTEWGHTTPIEALPLTKLFGIPADKVFPTVE